MPLDNNIEDFIRQIGESDADLILINQYISNFAQFSVENEIAINAYNFGKSKIFNYMLNHYEDALEYDMIYSECGAIEIYKKVIDYEMGLRISFENNFLKGIEYFFPKVDPQESQRVYFDSIDGGHDDILKIIFPMMNDAMLQQGNQEDKEWLRQYMRTAPNSG